MYKAIIVDDEKMIRMGMRKAIPWNLLGISEVFVAGSGYEALEVVHEHMPDIMITDINMDDMTGLDLIERTKDIVPDIRVMVLTGYDKFEYARQCIKLNVNDFFLKPIDENALIASIKKQVTFLEENNTEKTSDINRNRAKALTEQLDIEKFLRNLVKNRLTQKDEQIRMFCDKYNYDRNRALQISIIIPPLYMDNSEEENFDALFMKNICIGMIDAQNRGLTFSNEGRIVVVHFLDRPKESILEHLRELSDILADEYNKKPKIVLGNPVNGFELINISYNDAMYLLKNEKEEFDEIIQTKNALKKEHLFLEVFNTMKNAMCINVADTERVLHIFDRFCKATDSYNLSDSYIRKCCYELATSVYYAYICNSGKEPDGMMNSLIKAVLNVSGEEQFDLVRQFFLKLLGNKEDKNVHEIIDKAKFYIKEHMSEDVTVANIAEALHVAPNYFSRLFKRITGEGCNEYIVRKRIEKAKNLLETTSLKIYKIAVIVGYNDTNYFSLAFKKNTGLSPTKYREDYQKPVTLISGD